MPNTIICPQCRFEIEVTEVLSSQLREQIRKEFDAEQRQKEQELTAKAAELRTREQALEAAKSTIDTEVAARLAKERARVDQEALAKARDAVALELKDRDVQLAEATTKLKEAQDAELAVRAQAREIERQKNEFELTVARRMDEERAKIREQAKKEAADDRALKEAEKDTLIEDLRKQIADLQRKSEQGSQQTQGEVLEIELEEMLRRAFPYDSIEPVPKGMHGGDVLQRVRDGAGMDCGTILWESKRTKSWSNDWLPKLRDDQRAAKAQLSLLVSTELPKTVATFGCVDGVWVTNRSCSLGLALALRAGLIEVSSAKRSLDGRHGKMEILYAYLSGPDFRNRVQGIVEAFATLRNDLEAEKRAVQRIWAKREKQLDRAVTNTTGFYGDLQGIVGAALPAIDYMELPVLSDTANDPLTSADSLSASEAL